MVEHLIRSILQRSAAVYTILILLVVFGLAAYIYIPKESSPDIKVPVILVHVFQEGIAPEDAERLILCPLEIKLRTIAGIKQIKSDAFEGGVATSVEFFPNIDTNQALQEVRDKVDQARAKFPKEAEEPIIQEISLSEFPVLIINLTGDVPERTLDRISRDVKDLIESKVPSVLKILRIGQRNQVVEVVLDPSKMESLGITPEQLFLTTQKNHLMVAAGNLDTHQGRFAIKVTGYIQDPQDLQRFPVKTQGDQVVTLGDIATIAHTYKDPQSFACTNGNPAISLHISKRAGENILETIAAVRRVVGEARKGWPSHLNVSFAQDESTHIQEMLDDLQNNVIAAILLVMGVIVFSLGWRSAFLIGVAVPGSFLAGILWLSLMGYTMNIVVLFSLILAVGMLVDGAIIVVEYADRQLAEGVGKFEAYVQGASRMFWPVITSTVTILAVFGPLLFWPDVVGGFMRFLPITLIATLTASILMAIVFIPALGVRWGGIPPSSALHDHVSLSENGPLEALSGLTGAYVQVLQKALDYPARVIWGGVGLLFGAVLLYVFLGRGIEFFPNVEPDQATIIVHARGNLSPLEKDKLVASVEAKILDMRELKNISTQSGEPLMNDRPHAEDEVGSLTLEFVHWENRRPAEQILQEINERVQRIPGLRVEVEKKRSGPPGGKPIQLQLTSREISLLMTEAQRIRLYLDTLPELSGLEDDRPLSALEWKIMVDRAQAAKFDANVHLIGLTVRLLTGGVKVGSYRPEDAEDEVDILLRYPEAYRTFDNLRHLRIPTSKGMVPLQSLVEQKFAPKVSRIHHTGGMPSVLIGTDVKPGLLVNDVVQKIRAYLEQNPPSPDVHFSFKGDAEDQANTGTFLRNAFSAALCLIAMILMIQFNSAFSVFIVLSSVVLSTIGVFIGLLVMGQAFSIVMCGIGIIALAGIVVSNNIILIDTFDRLKHTVPTLREAIIRTGAQRLRPVILTKLTAILGLLPIMLRLNVDFIHLRVTYNAPAAQWWVQLSTCIVFGVLFASTLTLILTPCALLLRGQREIQAMAKEDLLKRR